MQGRSKREWFVMLSEDFAKCSQTHTHTDANNKPISPFHQIKPCFVNAL